MLITYEPNSDVLTLTLQASPVAQMQSQGAAQVGFDAAGNVVSVAVAEASTALWQHGGQINVLLPAAAPAATTVVETTRVVERPLP